MGFFHLIFSHPILLRSARATWWAPVASQDGPSTAQFCTGKLCCRTMGFAVNTQNCTIHTYPKIKMCFVLHWGIVWLKALRSYGSFALSPSHHNSNSDHSVQLSCLCQDFMGVLPPFLQGPHKHSVFLSSKNSN